MEPARKKSLSLVEYNQLEEETQQRYEYHQGEVFAMAGGDPKHGAIAGNAIGLLRSALFNKDCTIFTSDVNFYIEDIDRSLYPDVSVVGGSPQRSDKDAKALTNPIPLVKVLSDSTEGYDRGTKFRYYSTLPSLREYVLVEQNSWSVEVRYRPSLEERWQLELFSGSEAEIPLRSLDIVLPITELYRKTEL